MSTDINNYRAHYQKIKDFLDTWNLIWNFEVIQNGSQSSANYPADWVDCIMSLDQDILFEISTNSQRHAENNLPRGLSEFLEQISTLANITGILKNIPRIDLNLPNSVLPKVALQNLTPKKSYELQRIFHLLTQRNLLPYRSPVIDFCGGAGYAARTLAHFFNTPAISVDNDLKLQERGEMRTKNYMPPCCSEISFLNRDILLDDYDFIKSSLPFNSPLIGIHTCAHLSDIQLKLAVDLNSPWTLNIGCCYFKTSDIKYQLSEHAVKNPINYSEYALYLATRGQEHSKEGFNTSQRVKKYRFMLHLYLHSELSLDFIPVGSSPMSDYQLEFPEYAIGRLYALGSKNIIPYVPGRESLQRFTSDMDHQTTVSRMCACNYIRSFFSRLLELSITLDRVIFLEESGYTVELLEIFDPKISPRNLAILGHR